MAHTPEVQVVKHVFDQDQLDQFQKTIESFRKTYMDFQATYEKLQHLHEQSQLLDPGHEDATRL